VTNRDKLRVVLLLAGVGGLGLFGSGCGGSGAPSVANVGASTAASTPASRTPVVTGGGATPDSGNNPAGGPAAVFDQCLRTHGVTNMPNPSPGIKSPGTLGIDPNSSRFQKAERECVTLVPEDAPPGLLAHPVGPLLAFAKCMRNHGEPQFPDPDSEGHFHSSKMSGIDPDTLAFSKAIETCRPLADDEPISRVSP
jgi:hypothetical protein